MSLGALEKLKSCPVQEETLSGTLPLMPRWAEKEENGERIDTYHTKAIITTS